ncbi:hypothetical protein ACFHWW_26175 [Ensifer sp. P24N7]|uniref:hypothetical protein n=1 Tax=Sinorhizobium sp. P24N7 TaxID=3348358 RepID=UPI0035F4B6E8
MTALSQIEKTTSVPVSADFIALGTSREAAVLAGSLIGVAYLVSRGIDVALGIGSRA